MRPIIDTQQWKKVNKDDTVKTTAKQTLRTHHCNLCISGLAFNSTTE